MTNRQNVPDLACSNLRFKIGVFLVAIGISPASYAQLSYSEDFSTNTAEDAAQTTADWNTASSQLQLPVAPALTGTTFDASTVVEVIAGDFETRAVELADMDGDGDLDLVEGASGFNGVYLNNGDGTFASRSTIFVGANTRSIAVGDVDRDGDVDIASADFAVGIRLFLNDGSGTSFTRQEVSSVSGLFDQVALADINDDGLLDIVSSSLQFQTNKLFLNSGDPQVPFGVGGSLGIDIGSDLEETRHVAVGDLDLDGDLDLVFLNEDNPNPNNGNLDQLNRVAMNLLDQGSPNTFSTSEIGTDPADVDFSYGGALGDLDGDGYLDLVVINYRDGQTSKIYFNNGLGTANTNPFTIAAVAFTTAGPPSDPFFSNTASLADADGDGDLDIFMANADNAFRNRIYVNDGSGTITGFVDVGAIGQSPLPLQPADIGPVSTQGTLGDVDGDGDLDWILGNMLGQPTPVGDMPNILFRNAGSANGASVLQLRARAVSNTVDSSGATSVKLMPTPSTSMVGAQFHNHIDYWVTGNGGTDWSMIFPDSRPVSIVGGADVRWRAELRSESAATGGGLALLQLDIIENTSGPVVNTAIGPVEVVESDNSTGLPIISDISDADGDTVYHSVSGLPSGTGLSINPISGQVSGTPNAIDLAASPIEVTISGTDGSLSADDVFTLTVKTTTPTAPDFTSTAVVSGTQDVVYVYNVTADDPNVGETAQLIFSAPTLPAWLTLTDNGDGTAVLTGTPANADVGANAVTLTVADPGGLNNSQVFSIDVANANDQPTITSSGNAAATQNVTYVYNVTADDPDTGETALLTFTAPVLPPWLNFVDNGDGTASLSGTPSNDDVGDHAVSIAVADPGGLTDSEAYTISVANVNDQPTITSVAVTTATQDVAYSYGIVATDIDTGDTALLTMAAPTLPSWLGFVDNGSGSASLSGTPTNSEVGDHAVSVTATDPGGLSDTQNFTITVANVNDQPTITSVAVTAATQDSAYNYAVTAEDMDAGETAQLVFAAPALPAWLTLFDNGDGTAALSGTPGNDDVGDHVVSLTVADPGGLSDAQDFTITVANVNDAPVFGSTPVTAAAQASAYTYAAMATDPDTGDSAQLTVAAPTLPIWLSFSDNGGGMGSLTGTPGNADVGDHPVSLTVTDTGGLSTSQDFTISVSNVNDQPLITSVAVTTGTQGVAYAYAIAASDPDVGETGMLTFSAPNLPAWLTVTDNNDGTANLSGTPANSDVGDSSVNIVVTDPGGSSNSQSFTLSVANVNDVPAFSSAAVTAATQDAVYSYLVTAVDPDSGETGLLAFSAPTLPSWLVLNDNGDGTATLTGTPANADVDDHDVSLTVVDPSGASAMQDFTVTVVNVNDAPEFTSTAMTAATETVNYNYMIAVTDLDGDAVTISAPTVPSWLTFTDNGDGTATLSGTPSGVDVGTSSIILQSQDPGGLVGEQSFMITVTALADGPVITLNGADAISIDINRPFADPGAMASDPQDGDLTSEITVDNPVNINAAGTYTITYSVSDTAGNMAQAQRSVTVRSNASGGGGGGGSVGVAMLLALLLLSGSRGRVRQRSLGRGV